MKKEKRGNGKNSSTAKDISKNPSKDIAAPTNTKKEDNPSNHPSETHKDVHHKEDKHKESDHKEIFDIRKLFKTETIKADRTAKRRYFLKDALRKAGYISDERDFKERMWRANILATIMLSVFILVYGIANALIIYSIIALVALWVIGLPLFWLLSWALVYFMLDYMKYKRRKELEEVWPEYLQLVVSNINAGMLIDVALWNAVKPKYKILSKEIEDVAKQTLTGIELNTALRDFAERYDSPMLKRTISILIEGMESGGRIAMLLNKIALDIEDHKIMKKEMAASVMTYAIFISFATIVAAPFLFGLATTLLTIIQKIMGQVAQTSSASSSFINITGGTVKVSDFKIFAMTMLGITSLMSSMIISNIRKGSVRDGLKYIPIFMITTLVLYFVAEKLLSVLMGSLI